jgi:hypothetical protein
MLTDTLIKKSMQGEIREAGEQARSRVTRALIRVPDSAEQPAERGFVKI